jgi:hypothetical protein
MNWRKGVIENVIGRPATQDDPFRFVEGPMNAEINSASRLHRFRSVITLSPRNLFVV